MKKENNVAMIKSVCLCKVHFQLTQMARWTWMVTTQHHCGNGWRNRRAESWAPRSSGISPSLSSTKTGNPSPGLDPCQTQSQPSKMKLRNLSGSRGVSEFKPWITTFTRSPEWQNLKNHIAVNLTLDDLRQIWEMGSRSRMTPQWKWSEIHSDTQVVTLREEISYKRRKVWNSDNFYRRFVFTLP